MEDRFTNTVEDAARFEAARGWEPADRPDSADVDEPDCSCPECGARVSAWECLECGFYAEPPERGGFR